MNKLLDEYQDDINSEQSIKYNEIKFQHDPSIQIKNLQTSNVNITEVSKSKSESFEKSSDNFFDIKVHSKGNLLSLENLIIAIIVVMLMVLRSVFFPVTSYDYETFLKVWSNYIVNNGGFAAFKDRFYDYTPFYLYLMWIGTVIKVNPLVWVKVISIFFEFVLAFFVAKIVSLRSPNLSKYAFLVVLMLPSTIFNGSWWGQCDAVYSAFVVGTIYYILAKKQYFAFVMFALAISIKLQAVFIAPLFLILLITKNLSFKKLATLPAIIIGIYTLTIVPAFLAGRSLFDSKNGLYTVYLNQSNTYKDLVKGPAPTIYQWIGNNQYEYFYAGGLVTALVGVLFLALYFTKTNIKNISQELIVKVSMISVTIIPFLLPKMHERYFFLAEILAIVYCFWFPRKFLVGLVATTVSFVIYISAEIGGKLPVILTNNYLTLWYLLLIVYLVFDLVKTISSKKEMFLIKKSV